MGAARVHDAAQLPVDRVAIRYDDLVAPVLLADPASWSRVPTTGVALRVPRSSHSLLDGTTKPTTETRTLGRKRRKHGQGPLARVQAAEEQGRAGALPPARSEPHARVVGPPAASEIAVARHHTTRSRSPMLSPSMTTSTSVVTNAAMPHAERIRSGGVASVEATVEPLQQRMCTTMATLGGEEPATRHAVPRRESRESRCQRYECVRQSERPDVSRHEGEDAEATSQRMRAQQPGCATAAAVAHACLD